MDKRYQVFVSSTSKDLADDRRIVIDALLEASYIPVGMELFNAATESAWPVIERLIDSCDYYVVIVAGRYGTEIAGTGISFTQSEYNYAKSIRKPRLAFLHRNPNSLPREMTEETDAGMEKLRTFRRSLQEDLLCKFWSNAGGDELARKIVSALNTSVITDPQPGWVRGDDLDVLGAELRRNIIAPARQVGIQRISTDGQSGPNMSESIAASRDIAIMATSATRIIEIQKRYLIEAVARGATLRVLVPEINKAFVRDVDESESQDVRRDPISREIAKVKDRLYEIAAEAQRSTLGNENDATACVSLGYFSTHLRSTLVLCDNTWGWLTITLPPARAAETPSFELTDQGQRSLIHASRRHFDRTWQVALSRKKVQVFLDTDGHGQEKTAKTESSS